MIPSQYIHLPPTSSLEQLSIEGPFAAVVTIDANVTPEWRYKVSEWLVKRGCLYMMANGDECSLWDDSVDWANIEAHDFNDIPEDKLVMTTWHEDETLQEVFYFAISSVNFYPRIRHMLVLDISHESREAEIIKILKAAQDEADEDRENDTFEHSLAPDANDVSLLNAFLGGVGLTRRWISNIIFIVQIF